MARSITIVRAEAGDETNLGPIGAIRLLLTATEPVNIDPAIFVWQRKPKSPHRTEEEDICSHVASPADMEEFPVGEPDPGSPFFRLTYADMLFRSVVYLEETITRTLSNVRVLLEGLDALDTLETVSTLCVGECDSGDSDSASA